MVFRRLSIYLLVVNLIAFVLFFLDKQFARAGARRIPERTLMGIAAAGGSLGAVLGMYICHHKTLHKKFALGLPLLLMAHVFILLALFYYGIIPIAQ